MPSIQSYLEHHGILTCNDAQIYTLLDVLYLRCRKRVAKFGWSRLIEDDDITFYVFAAFR